MKTTAIIIDLDGTLSNCAHRRHLAESSDWGGFYAGIGDDSVNAWCYELLYAMRDRDYQVILCSGRPDGYRRVTELWLLLNSIDYTELFMRKDGDSRNDAIVKEEILHRDILPKYDVLFAVDDRQRVVDMWRRNGIITLQCDEGNF